MPTRLLQVSAFSLVMLPLTNCGGGDEAGGGGSGGAGGASGSDAAAGTTGDASLGGASGSGATAGVAGAAASGGSAGVGGGSGTDAGGADAGGADAGGGAGVSGSAGVGGFDPTCYNCHGTTGSPNPAPPKDTSGNTATSGSRVGAHQSHLGASTWHAEFKCTECHLVPTALWDTGHIDTSLPAEVLWGPAALADGASPAWGGTTCSGVYCHGATIKNTGANSTPNWTTVDGSQSECGKSCHTTPPSDGHPANNNCKQCHGAVINNFAGTASTWTDATKHINGIVEVVGGATYHDLPNWTTPQGNGNHHGSKYFLTNQQRDEHNALCSNCHGANLDGGTSGVSCNNNSCHGSDWKSCNFCHGTPPTQSNPPVGVGGETLTNTLAVGRHVAHLNASSSHVAFACSSCHSVPAAGNVSHALQYVASANLQSPGHHGDVAFSGLGAGMTWNVNATQGNPVAARGTCVGGCHSNGNGGPPNVTPYWAGGNWTTPCNNCHSDPPKNGEHDKHVNGEKLPCTSCHFPANSATHVNGQTDVRTNINGPSGGSVTYNPNACGNGNPGCSGTCHGENHNAECW